MKVTLSDKFKIRIPTFDDDTRQAILGFIAHVKQHGLKGLQGRNKSSAKPNPHTKKEQADFKNATKNCLWHYHIGVPNYVGEFGDMTRSIFYIISDLMMRLSWWILVPTHRLSCRISTRRMTMLIELSQLPPVVQERILKAGFVRK